MDDRNDLMAGAFAPDGGCLSGDPYCSRNPTSGGTYEAYSGALCGECEDAVADDERAKNTDPPGDAFLDDDDFDSLGAHADE